MATKDDWRIARLRWETDPTVSGSDIARELDVSRNAVSLRIKKEQWARVGVPADLARRAADRADIDTARAALEQQRAQRSENQKAALVEAIEAAEAGREELAVDLRATVIMRHRGELGECRTLVEEAIKKRDFELAKLGKITAEAKVIIQNAERKAWGLDVEEKSTDPTEVKVTIERREVPVER